MTADRVSELVELDARQVEQYNVLKLKLDSKNEALHILSRELDQCRCERDQYKLLSEQLRLRCNTLRKSVDGKISDNSQNKEIKVNNGVGVSLQERKKAIYFEVEELKQKLQDAQGDIKLLREQIARQRVGSTDEGVYTRLFPAHERESLVQQLESLKVAYNLVEKDLQSVLDEKEELVTERDSYKTKVERLNLQLHFILRGDDKRVIDVDALVMENRYLQEKLKQTQEEKSIYLKTLSKYKNILEKRKNKSGMTIGANGKSGVIITHKQVQKMLHNCKLSELPATQATIADLRSLALALFESLNDKSVALTHQRKANKLLGMRVADLESKIKSLEELEYNQFAINESEYSETSNKYEKFRNLCEKRPLRNKNGMLKPFCFDELENIMKKDLLEQEKSRFRQERRCSDDNCLYKNELNSRKLDCKAESDSNIRYSLKLEEVFSPIKLNNICGEKNTEFEDLDGLPPELVELIKSEMENLRSSRNELTAN